VKNTIFFKTMNERKWFTLGWTIGLIAFAALMVSFFPAMHQDGALDDLVSNMPKAFEGLVGDLANLKNFPSYLASQLFDIRLPILVGIMAIILGQSLSTKEEERGELRTVLALRVSRAKLFIQKWLALILITGLAVIGLGIGIYSTVPFTAQASLDFIVFLRLGFMTWLLMIAFGTITFAIGMATGSKAMTTLISTLLIVGSFIISTFSSAIEWLASVEKFSLLSYFPAVDIAQYGIAKKDVAILLMVIVISLIVSIICFRRRDIKG
jgi:ABC-type transport system involved in multi-copper enzyme maturation permease subunit